MSSVWLALAVGVLVGIISGLVGIGGGVIMVPIFVYGFKMDQHMAQGTSLAALLAPIGISTFWEYYQACKVNGKVVLLVAIGFAVGGYFGARLAQAGRDVTFLVRPSRAKQLQSEGLRIVSPHGDLALQPKTITAQELASPFDIIFLSVKALALDQAMDDLSHGAGSDTMIYPVLNGMRHIETSESAAGRQLAYFMIDATVD